MACPIAYISADESIWICDPTGERHYLVRKNATWSNWIRWSPRGYRLLYAHGNGTFVLDAISKRVTAYPIELENPIWIGDEEVLGSRYFGSYNEVWKLDLRTGQYSQFKRTQALGLPCGQFKFDYEPTLTDGYIVSEADSMNCTEMDIVVRDLNWNERKAIWRDASNDIEDWSAELDPLGEFVAWTRARSPGTGTPKSVAVKRFDADSSEFPMMIGSSFETAAFCSWSVRSEILAAVTENGKTSLALFASDGRPIRKLNTPNGLRTWFDCAHYRKDEHW